MSELITNSRQTTFRTCPRLHHYKYVLGYRSLRAQENPEFGLAWHAGLEAWWLAYAEGRELLALDEALAAIQRALVGAEALDDGAAARLRVLMVGYHARWASLMGEYEVIAVEREFRGPLIGPAGKRARGLKVAGKIDVLVRKRSDGSIWIVEHKTSGSDLSPGSAYWQRLRMDSQISMYWDGARALGYQVAGCLYDVVFKPKQRPFKATPQELRKYTKDGRLYANQREHDETIAEYEERIASDVAEKPELYFQRAEVVRLDEEIEQARCDTYDTAVSIREAKRLGRAPRNPNACFQMYGGTCEFQSVCGGEAAIDDPTRFKRLDHVHPELSNDT